MKFKDMRIGTWLFISFTIILTFVLALGLIAYSQTQQLQQQVETMYLHPLKVRRAIDHLELDISELRVGLRDLILAETDTEEQDAIQGMVITNLGIENHFDTIEELYLGPSTDVEEVYKAFIIWNFTRQENIELVVAGDTETVMLSILDDGEEGVKRDVLLSKIKVINDYAQLKADELFDNSIELDNNLTLQLSIIVAAIFFLTLIIGFWLYRSIRNPIFEINNIVLKFHSGNMNARVSYSSKNELGNLAYSINKMANAIQENENLNQQTIEISDVMISENEAHEFFKVTLNALATHTNSQIAAVYLLSDDKEKYEHFESVGLSIEAKKSFSSRNLEGEFGAVLSTGKLQHIKDIPNETHFVFNTINGSFIPKEIITIPITSNNQIIAVISLGTIKRFDVTAINLIEKTLDGISARIESILSNEKVKEFIFELEQQSTELLEQNAELEMQKAQLDEANRMKSNFLSNMSHELRTPLNSVIALSGVLYHRLENQIPDEEYGYLEIIGRNGKNLLNLINDILDISRIESGHEEIEITRFDVNVLIDDIVTMIDPQTKEKNISLLQKKKNLNLNIYSDNDKCRHILQNLIGNAVKFTDKGQVVISAYQNGNNLVVDVVDTGIGIAPEFLDNVFEEFRQVDGGTARKHGGTGLGLAIAKKYSNLLGGTISVTSKLGVGSKFTLTLPSNYNGKIKVNEQENKLDKYVISNNLDMSNKNLFDKTVLLVEDNESAIIQIKDLVEGMGVNVVTAINGKEALESVKHNIPDAMILDLMMPDIDGFEVLKTLRNNDSTAHVPVLILTAKHITKRELNFLRRNNIHQLIQKGDVDRIKLQTSIFNMIYPKYVDVNQQKKSLKKTSEKPVILIVEDNADNMVTVVALLSDYGVTIEAMDGEKGIELAKKHKPDLILMDIALPGISGIVAFHEIRNTSELKNIPIIALTASAMEADKEDILLHGFNHFIAKPIIRKDFFKIIEEVLYGK